MFLTDNLIASMLIYSLSFAITMNHFYSTPILISGTESLRKIFMNAPEDIQAQYDWHEMEATQSLMDAIKEVSQDR